MCNVVKPERQKQVLHMLVEGSSIRSTCALRESIGIPLVGCWSVSGKGAVVCSITGCRDWLYGTWNWTKCGLSCSKRRGD